MMRCPSCCFEFESVGWLISHLRQPGSECCVAPDANQQFDCPLCRGSQFPNLVFSTARDFADHLELCHLPEDEARNLNNTGWRPSEHQKAEVKRYRGSPYQCQFCQRHFLKKVDCKRHERIHTGERPFACAECDCRFKLKQHLETHRRTHRIVAADKQQPEEEQHCCTVCQKQFLSRSALKLHLRIHTGETPFKCVQPGCPMAFRTKKLMLCHHKNAHYGENTPEEELLAIEREQQNALEALTALNGQVDGKKLKTQDLLLHHSMHASAFQPFRREMPQQNGSELNQLQNHSTMPQNQQLHEQYIPDCIGSNNNNDTAMQQQLVQQHTQQGNMFVSRLLPPLPSQQQQQPQQYSYFQTADAEYTRQGQVHCRNPPPSQQFRRTLTPTFAYYFSNDGTTMADL